MEVYLRRYTEQRGSTAHSEPGQRFQPSHSPNTSWYILIYFNFSALSSALSCLISCARDFFGSALDNVQERVALTCAKADFYNVNLKGEVKTTPKKKKTLKKTLNHFKGRGGKTKMLFGAKSGSVAEANGKHRCSGTRCARPYHTLMCLFKMVYEEKRLTTHKQTNFQSVLVNTLLREIAPLQSRRWGISKVQVEIKAARTDQTELGWTRGRRGEQLLHNTIFYFSGATVPPENPESFGNVSVQVW